MIKRTLCVFVCIFVIAALSLSVFAAENTPLPDNDVAGVITLRSINVRYDDYFTGETGNYTVNINDSYPFGSLQLLGTTVTTTDFNSVIYSVRLYFNFDVTVNQDNTTIYYPIVYTDTYDESMYNFGNLDLYRYSSGDVSLSVPFTPINYNIKIEPTDSNYNISYSKGQTTDDAGRVRNVKFLCFRGVPRNTYNVSTYGAYDDPQMFSILFYAVAPFISVPTLFDEVELGIIEPSEALDNVYNSLNDVLNSNLSVSEKQLAAAVAALDIEHIKDAAFRPISQLIGNFSLSDIASNYSQANSIPILNAMRQQVFSIISMANIGQQTAESTNVAYNYFSFVLSLENSLYEFNKQRIEDSIITDEDLADNDEKLEHLVDIYDQEKLAQDAYKDLDLEQLIDINQWNLDVNDFVSYRQIFDQFFKGYSDSGSPVVAMCVSFPFTLLIVSLILGTSGVVFSFTRKD